MPSAGSGGAAGGAGGGGGGAGRAGAGAGAGGGASQNPASAADKSFVNEEIQRRQLVSNPGKQEDNHHKARILASRCTRILASRCTRILAWRAKSLKTENVVLNEELFKCFRLNVYLILSRWVQCVSKVH